jgi:hypothetical protein
MTKQVVLGLIAVTTLIFVAAFNAAQEYTIGAFALALGLAWAMVEAYEKRSVASIFFACFLGLAILGNLGHVPVVMMLFGLSTGLAAWDLSRFRARAVHVEHGDIAPALERTHLRKLVATMGAGFVLALLPVMFTIPMTFLGLALVTLTAIIMLRNSMRYIRPED